MTVVRIARSAVGMSLLTTGLTWMCWQMVSDIPGSPPTMLWAVIALTGFVLLPKRWGRRGKPTGEKAA